MYISSSIFLDLAVWLNLIFLRDLIEKEDFHKKVSSQQGYFLWFSHPQKQHSNARKEFDMIDWLVDRKILVLRFLTLISVDVVVLLRDSSFNP